MTTISTLLAAISDKMERLRQIRDVYSSTCKLVLTKCERMNTDLVSQVESLDIKVGGRNMTKRFHLICLPCVQLTVATEQIQAEKIIQQHRQAALKVNESSEELVLMGDLITSP